MSEELKDIITKLLERNPNTRLGSKQDIDEVKAHPFFKGINWDALYNRTLQAEYKPTIDPENNEQQLIQQ